MADLGFFNAYGWEFQQAIKGLVRSFRLAASAIDAQVDKATDAIRDYQEHLDRGGEPIGEWDDEDGSRIWSQDQVLDWDLLNIREAAMALRKAYALQFYHLWERSAQAWTSSAPNTGHGDLVAKTKAQGYPIDPKLEAVKHLANTLKHGNPKHGMLLYRTWPEIVPRAFAFGPGPGYDWYAEVVLTEADVAKVALIVGGSGPVATVAELYR